MRITAGKLGGRRLRVPAGDVRPTQDRVREALFSMLAGRTAGARFLDLCAGSGAVGIEAWSRGAALVWFVERNRRVLSVLKSNVATLCPRGDVRVVAADALSFARRFEPGRHGGFDLVFCDPPYRRTARPPRGADGREGPGWSTKLLAALAEGEVVTDGGRVIVEVQAGAPDELPTGWERLNERRYGGSCLRFYRRA